MDSELTPTETEPGIDSADRGAGDDLNSLQKSYNDELGEIRQGLEKCMRNSEKLLAEFHQHTATIKHLCEMTSRLDEQLRTPVSPAVKRIGNHFTEEGNNSIETEGVSVSQYDNSQDLENTVDTQSPDIEADKPMSKSKKQRLRRKRNKQRARLLNLENNVGQDDSKDMVEATSVSKQVSNTEAADTHGESHVEAGEIIGDSDNKKKHSEGATDEEVDATTSVIEEKSTEYVATEEPGGTEALLKSKPENGEKKELAAMDGAVTDWNHESKDPNCVQSAAESKILSKSQKRRIRRKKIIEEIKARKLKKLTKLEAQISASEYKDTETELFKNMETVETDEIKNDDNKEELGLTEKLRDRKGKSLESAEVQRKEIIEDVKVDEGGSVDSIETACSSSQIIQADREYSTSDSSNITTTHGKDLMKDKTDLAAATMTEQTTTNKENEEGGFRRMDDRYAAIDELMKNILGRGIEFEETNPSEGVNLDDADSCKDAEIKMVVVTGKTEDIYKQNACMHKNEARIMDSPENVGEEKNVKKVSIGIAKLEEKTTFHCDNLADVLIDEEATETEKWIETTVQSGLKDNINGGDSFNHDNKLKNDLVTFLQINEGENDMNIETKVIMDGKICLDSKTHSEDNVNTVNSLGTVTAILYELLESCMNKAEDRTAGGRVISEAESLNNIISDTADVSVETVQPDVKTNVNTGNNLDHITTILYELLQSCMDKVDDKATGGRWIDGEASLDNVNLYAKEETVPQCAKANNSDNGHDAVTAILYELLDYSINQIKDRTTEDGEENLDNVDPYTLDVTEEAVQADSENIVNIDTITAILYELLESCMDKTEERIIGGKLRDGEENLHVMESYSAKASEGTAQAEHEADVTTDNSLDNIAVGLAECPEYCLDKMKDRTIERQFEDEVEILENNESDTAEARNQASQEGSEDDVNACESLVTITTILYEILESCVDKIEYRAIGSKLLDGKEIRDTIDSDTEEESEETEQTINEDNVMTENSLSTIRTMLYELLESCMRDVEYRTTGGEECLDNINSDAKKEFTGKEKPEETLVVDVDKAIANIYLDEEETVSKYDSEEANKETDLAETFNADESVDYLNKLKDELSTLAKRNKLKNEITAEKQNTTNRQYVLYDETDISKAIRNIPPNKNTGDELYRSSEAGGAAVEDLMEKNMITNFNSEEKHVSLTGKEKPTCEKPLQSDGSQNRQVAELELTMIDDKKEICHQSYMTFNELYMQRSRQRKLNVGTIAIDFIIGCFYRQCGHFDFINFDWLIPFLKDF